MQVCLSYTHPERGEEEEKNYRPGRHALETEEAAAEKKERSIGQREVRERERD